MGNGVLQIGEEGALRNELRLRIQWIRTSHDEQDKHLLTLLSPIIPIGVTTPVVGSWYVTPQTFWAFIVNDPSSPAMSLRRTVRSRLVPVPSYFTRTSMS